MSTVEEQGATHKLEETSAARGMRKVTVSVGLLVLNGGVEHDVFYRLVAFQTTVAFELPAERLGGNIVSVCGVRRRKKREDAVLGLFVIR